MNLHIDLKQTDDSTRVIKVSAPAETVERRFDEVTLAVQREASLPGFRKGKAPKDLILKNFSRKIQEEVLDRLISETYREALSQTRSVPIEKPRFENVSFQRGQALSYQLTLEVLPKAKVAKYQDLKLKRPKVKVEDQQVDAVLERLRVQHAVLTTVEGRPSRSGDVITVDFAGRHEGQPVASMTAEDYAFELGAQQTIPDFDTALVGLASGEEKTFPATFPKDYHAKEWAGKSVEFTAKVKALQEKKLAELDDAFAKEMGAFDTLADLRRQIQEDLKREQERNHQILLRDQVTQHLGKTTQVKVPPVLVQRALDKLVRDEERRLREAGKTWEQAGLTPDAFKDKNREQAEFQLKAHLGLLEIGEAEKIQVTEADVSAEVERLARLMRQTPEAIRQYLDKVDGWEDIQDRIRTDKTMERIIELAKVVEA